MNITLIGMSGVGKSYFGREVAKRLKFRFIDVDDLIRKRIGSLQEYIDKRGEKSFLKIEEEEILKLHSTNALISPGGSVIYSEKAISHLKQISKIIYLKATLDSIKSWVPGFEKRGIIGMKKGLKKLHEERARLYKLHSDEVIEITKDYDYETIIKRIIDSAKTR